jgi:hypothetical protein
MMIDLVFQTYQVSPNISLANVDKNKRSRKQKRCCTAPFEYKFMIQIDYYTDWRKIRL